jgi:putative colanic acid biosynthesis glycosyltransferase
LINVSIVSIVKNDAIGLKNTFESLQSQDAHDWEMIIVVGQSSDSTPEIAQSIQEKDGRVRVLNQSESGIYPAMNEGLSHVKGEFVWFMNAGDRFFDSHSLGIALAEIKRRSLDLLLGGHGVASNSEISLYPSKKTGLGLLDFAFNRRSGCHQAMIFRTSAVKSHNGFNTKYQFASDYDLVLSLIELKQTGRHAGHLSIVAAGGVSDRNLPLVHREKNIIRLQHHPGPLMQIASRAWWFSAIMKIYVRKNLKKKKTRV